MKLQKTEPRMTLRLQVALLWLTASLVWFFAPTSAVYAQEMNCELRESDSAWDRFWNPDARIFFRNGKLIATGNMRENKATQVYEKHKPTLMIGTVSKGDISIDFGVSVREEMYNLNSVHYFIRELPVDGYIIKRSWGEDSTLRVYYRKSFNREIDFRINYDSVQPLMSIMDDLICITKGIDK